MKAATVYTCEVCGTDIRSKRLAERCESNPLPPPLSVAPGDDVFVCERYDGWQPSRVKAIEVWPSYAVAMNREIADGENDEHLDRIMTMHPVHRFIVRLDREHQFGKDHYSDLVSPGSVKLRKDDTVAVDGSDVPDYKR